METNKNKWHARIVHFPDVQLEGYISDKCIDFCSYLRCFFLKLFLVIPLICMLIGGFLGRVFGELAGVLTTLTYHAAYAPFLTFTLILLSTLALCFFTGFLMYLRSEATKGKPPGFIATAYEKHKSKFCPPLDYTGD